jgi:hypothetical protein
MHKFKQTIIKESLVWELAHNMGINPEDIQLFNYDGTLMNPAEVVSTTYSEDSNMMYITFTTPKNGMAAYECNCSNQDCPCCP